MSNTKSSCFNRLCEDSTCTHMHAGEVLFVPSPCPYGKACPNGENCRCFHSHHRHTLRNCKPDVLKRFLETCAMSISTDTSREDRMEWRNRVRTYISHGRFSLRITEIAESSSRKRRVAVKRRRSRSRSRSHSPDRTSGRSRSPSRSRSRSRSASRSRSRSTSRSRERVQEESVASSSTRSSANANGMFDKTVSMMRDFTEGDLSVMYKVARSLSSETD